MKISNFFLKLIPTKTVYAHCDIPCGIYDPHVAQMAAHTVIRMTTLIGEAKGDVHKIARMTHVKEDHGAMVEHELETLENDYFKEEHFIAHPDLKETIAKAVKLSAKARQEINLEAANELLANVQKIAEIFWKTKGVESARIKAPYPSGGEIVVPKA